MKKRYNLTFTPEVKADFDELCDDKGTTASAELERYMRGALARRDRKTTNVNGDENE